jgi:biopolymer transport protein ExbD
MKKLRAQEESKAVIPTASMADIAFLLIIFFMLTFTIEVDRTQVTLPQTMIRNEVPKKAAMISVDTEGNIRVSDGEQMSSLVQPEDVLSFAAEVVATDPSKEFIIKADTDTPYRIVDGVIDALKQAKAQIIYLLSQQETTDGAAPAGGA